MVIFQLNLGEPDEWFPYLSRPRGRPKRTWTEVVREDCQARKMNKEDVIDRCKWRKMIKDVRRSGWVWVGECFFWYRPIRAVPEQRPLNGCVCVWVPADPGSPGKRAVKRACMRVHSNQLCLSVCTLALNRPTYGLSFLHVHGSWPMLTGDWKWRSQIKTT